MSSTVLSTTAAQGRFFVFYDAGLEAWPDEVCPQEEASQPRRTANALAGPAFGHAAGADYLRRIERSSRWLGMTTPASRLAERPAPEMVSSGIAEIDALAGGLPRSCLTEISGPASSGRTTLLLAALTAATRRGEVCAVVDASDVLDPQSAAAAGIDLDRLLWVRCGEGAEKKKSDKQTFKFGQNESHSAEHRLEQLLRATDLLLESGGFGLIALDLCDLPPQTARRIPLTTWFRFRRAVEHTPTVLLVIERQSFAGSCSSLLIKLGLTKLGAAGNRTKEENAAQVSGPAHAHPLTTLEITAEVVRSRLERKPAGPVSTTFASKTAWAG
jgi:hypothetical protein